MAKHDAVGGFSKGAFDARAGRRVHAWVLIDDIIFIERRTTRNKRFKSEEVDSGDA